MMPDEKPKDEQWHKDIAYLMKDVEKLLDKTPACIYVNGIYPPRTVWANEFGMNYIAYTPEEYEKFRNYENNADFVHPDDVDIVGDLFQVQKDESLERVFRMRAGENREYRYFSAKVVPYSYLPTGEVDLILCAAIDVTDFLEREKGLMIKIDRLEETMEVERKNLFNNNKRLLLELEEKKTELMQFKLKTESLIKSLSDIKSSLIVKKKDDNDLDKIIEKIDEQLFNIKWLINS